MNDATAIDLGAYRQRIGDEGPLAATAQTLARLVARHAAAIPFENIDVLAGRVPALDVPSLQAKLVGRPRGGYCFEQNHLFMACLRQIGFEVRGLEARVRAGVAADVVTARTHMALCVTLEGIEHLVDVGFGGMAPTAPLRLRDTREQRAHSGVYRLVEQPEGELLLQARHGESWSDCYQIGRNTPHPIDYEMGNWFVATHSKAMLRSNLLVARAIEGGRLTLFNRELTRRAPENGEAERRTLATRSDFDEVLRGDFGLGLGDEEIDAVMAVIAQR